MKIYLAGSFAYTDREKTEFRKAELLKAKHVLEARGFDVHSPSEIKITNAWDYTMSEWGLIVFTKDVTLLESSDIMVMLDYGKENNAGVAWECGYAFAKGTKVIVVKMNDSPMSIMVLHGSYAQVEGLSGLSEYDFNLLPKTRVEAIES